MIHCSCLEHKWTLKEMIAFFPEHFINLFMARGHLKCVSQFGSQVSKVTGFSPQWQQWLYNVPGTTLFHTNLIFTPVLLNIMLHCQNICSSESLQGQAVWSLVLSRSPWPLKRWSSMDKNQISLIQGFSILELWTPGAESFFSVWEDILCTVRCLQMSLAFTH